MTSELEVGLLNIVTVELQMMRSRLRLMTIILTAILTALGIDLSRFLG